MRTISDKYYYYYRIIWHIGTKSSQTTQNITDSIVNLAEQIQSDLPNTKVSISALLNRKEPELWAKAQVVNRFLRKFCGNRICICNLLIKKGNVYGACRPLMVEG